MAVTSLRTEMHIALHCATVDVYNKFIKRCIVDHGDVEKRYDLLKSILKEVVIPDKVLMWSMKCEMDPHLQTIELLIEKKTEVDEFIRNVLTLCQKEGYDKISIKQLNDIAIKLHPAIKMSFKIYLFELLLDGRYYPYIYREDTTFPLKNISRNYKTIEKTIDEALTKAAYYARYHTLRKLYMTQESKKLGWKFQPSTNAHHADILKWIRDNVKKGEENPDACLGWSSGPDSAPWPSTNLCDYKRTLHILYEIME